jgi:hypothetical protein
MNQREAAEWLGVPLARVQNWYQGRSEVPADVMLKIWVLIDKQTREAKYVVCLITDYGLTVKTALDEAEKIDGWPTKSAHDAMLGRVLAMIY